jgi:hypothetical protein
MKLECKTYDEHGCHIVEDLCPEGFKVVDEHTPCSSTTPWDYYGLTHVRQYCKALKLAGIEVSIMLETRRRLLHPRGTGPRGSVRLGDDMVPHTYKIAVRAEDENAANVAIAAHKAAVQKWAEGPITERMPEACYV